LIAEHYRWSKVMASVFMEKISIVIPEILLCEDSGMAAVLNRWMAIIMRPQTLPGLEAKFGLKPKHRRFGEWLPEEVSNLISRGDVLSYEMTKSNPFTYKVIVQFNMLTACIKHRINSHVKSTKIVRVENRGDATGM
jgi:hypothetical protein